MALVVYTLDQSEQWNAIVRNFKNYDVYWLNGYVKAFYIHGDGTPLLFHYDDGGTRGINVVMKRDVADDYHFTGKLDHGIFYDFATPYGYGGWLIEGDNRSNLFYAYEDWCDKNGIVSEFVRFHPVIGNQASADAYDVVPLGNTVVMDLSSPEIIWENIISKNRNMIRKALKNGIKIFNGRFPEIYSVFRDIYNSTMDKDHAEAYYYFDEQFYKSILEDLPYNAQVFYAELDGKVIAASIMLATNGRMNYHLSGSIREFSHLAPTNLLLYEAALWGNANNYRTFYLGGGVGSGEDSLFKFKRSFYRGEELKRFCIGKKVINKEKYNYLLRIRDKQPQGVYFPSYRG